MREPPQPKSRGTSVRGAAAWAIAAQYIAFGIQFLTTVVVSRFFLAPSEVGLFSIALAAAMMVAVFQDFGLTRYVASLHVVSDAEIRRCSCVAVLFSWLIAAALFAGAPLMGRIYANAGLVPILWTIAVSYVFSPFSIIPYAMLSREMAFNRIFAVNVATATIQSLTVIGLAWAGYSAMSLAWGMVAASLARAALTQMFSPSLPYPFQLSGLAAIVRFGSQSSFLAAIGAAGARSADLIIGKLLSLAATGVYSRSTGLASQLRALVTGAIGSVLYPAIARLNRQGEPLGEPYLRIVGCYTAGTWPTMAGLAVAAEPMVESLFGPRWSAVAPVLRLIAISEMLFEAVPMQVDIPILLGAINRLTVRNIVDTLASVILLLVGVSISVEAAAASRIAYGAVWFVIYISFICELIHLPVQRLIPVYAKGLIACAAAVAPLAVGRLLIPDFTHCGLFTLAVLALVGVGQWLIALRLLRHPLADEIAHILSGIALRRRGQPA